jgi:glycosyltransferase involved in cell wall biosynthesis
VVSANPPLLRQVPLAEVAEQALAVGLRRILIVAWRDLDDPEAGGSELHAHEVARAWAEAGIEVTQRTSDVAGQPAVIRRDGYRAVRKAGRYAVFPRSALSGMVSGNRRYDGLVEIWNGMPFCTPLWWRGPSIVILHHVHAEMWQMALPRLLAVMGRSVEQSWAPPLYRRSRIVTVSQSSRDEIVHMLGIPAGQITVVPPGVAERFSSGGTRSPDPLVLAVGRLVPVKRFDELMVALAAVRKDHPRLRAVIVGEGYKRDPLEACRRRLGAEDWLTLPGHLPGDELVDLYRAAWVVTSASQREGWGMTITEAGACGTPSVATRIAGHSDAVVDGRTGLLVDNPQGLAEALSRVIGDDGLRQRLAIGALELAQRFTWECTASGILRALVDEVRRR